MKGRYVKLLQRHWTTLLRLVLYLVALAYLVSGLTFATQQIWNLALIKIGLAMVFALTTRNDFENLLSNRNRPISNLVKQ